MAKRYDWLQATRSDRLTGVFHVESADCALGGRFYMLIRALRFLPIVVIIVAWLFGNLDSVVTTWLSANQTASIDFFGMPMLLWGRLGKILQFLAGCVVVLDLIGPQRLRSIERRYRDRLENARIMRKNVKSLRELTELEDEIVSMTCRGYPPVSSSASLLILYQSRISAEKIDEFCMAVCRPMQSEPEFNRKDKYSMEALRNTVRRFIYENVPPNDRETVRCIDEYPWLLQKSWSTCAFVMLMHIFVAPIALISAGWVTAENPILNLVALSGLINCLFILTHKVDLFVWRMTLSAAVIGQFGVSFLERCGPGGKVRWIAFWLFLTGFALDLLAS